MTFATIARSRTGLSDPPALPILRALHVVVLATVLAGLTSEPARADPETEMPAPFVLVLGTAQDGGLPQAGCGSACCERVRRAPGEQRRVASLLVVDPRSGGRWLIDATPDLPEQLALADEAAPRRPDAPSRRPFDGIFLTHAHVGHYAGLVHLGREVMGARGVPVHATKRMRAFLSSNGPWDQLVELGNVSLEPLKPGTAVALAEDLSVTPLAVPHRDEYSDTVGFVIAGPERALLYIPDIDKWARWERKVEDELRRVDVALLDATFFDADELPGRSMAEIPHPFVVETIERLAPLPASERSKVHLTHLNHTNPIADADSAAAARVRAAGLHVAHDGDRFEL